MHCKKFRPRPLPSLRNMEFRVQMTASGQIGASGRPKMREGGDTESIPCAAPHDRVSKANAQLSQAPSVIRS